MDNALLNKKYKELYDFLDEYGESAEDSIILSIILPVYNEEKTIKKLASQLPLHKSIEIIVVDDCSTDNSVKEVEKVREEREIKIFRHQKNRGYGGAIITGIKNSKGDVIVTIDADGQHNPFDIFTLIKPILNKEADCSIGSRYLGAYHYNLPIVTRLGEAVVETLIRIFFGPKVSNNQSGYRAFHKNMTHLFNDVLYYGFTFATEIILKASLYNYKIKECPIILIDRKYGRSKIVVRVLLINIFACLFKYYIKKIKRFSPKYKILK